MDPLSLILGVGGKLIDRFWPDPETKAKALQQLREIDHNELVTLFQGDVELMKAQIEVNKTEAMHGGLFKGGWRPFVGWVCGIALAYKFLFYPFIISAVQVIGHYLGAQPFPLDLLPVIDWQELMTILLGMLGLGGMRSFEKYKTLRSASQDVQSLKNI